jgi:hypothetical protein
MLLHEAARKNDTVLFQFSIPEKKRKLNGQWQKGCTARHLVVVAEGFPTLPFYFLLVALSDT